MSVIFMQFVKNLKDHNKKAAAWRRRSAWLGNGPPPGLQHDSQLKALAGAFHDVSRIDYRCRSALARFKAYDNVAAKIRLTAKRRLRYRDGPIFHVGECLAKIADKPPTSSHRPMPLPEDRIRRYASRLSTTR